VAEAVEGIRGMQSTVARAFPVPILATLLSAILASAPGAGAAEVWPSRVSASYKITFNGFDVGNFQFESSVNGRSYALSGNAELSALLGIFKWHGATRSSGTIAGEAPKPANYTFDYKSNSKTGSVKLAFANGRVASTTLVPPSNPSKNTVPVQEQHLDGVLDPMSAVMALTRGKVANPCGRRISVFDGKQRFDLVFSFRRQLKVTEAVPSGQPGIAFVCRVRYFPIAGHKLDEQGQIKPGDSGIEVAFRPIPSANLLIPYQITIPTFVGSAVMTAQRVDITTPGMREIALVH
jgi:hypothetical protein